MTARTAEDQIRELTRGLEPVRPIPSLRSVLAGVVLSGLLAFAVHSLLGGPGLRPGGSVISSLPYLATLSGLALAALGALGGALAAAVPGREESARLGTRAARLGLVTALAGGLSAFAAGDAVWTGEEFSNCLSCIVRAVALGAVPVLVACVFIVYAAAQRAKLGTALALAGGVALGSALVHMTCPSDSPMHWLVAHTIAPVLAVVLLTVPLAALLAHGTRRR